MKTKTNLAITNLTLAALFSCQSAPEANVETHEVNRGEFVVSVTETGELQAVTSQTISAPRIPWSLGGLKIARFVEDGKQVKKDEVLAEFDKTEVQKNLDDAKAALEIALAEVRKAEATQTSEIEELESNLKKSELQYRISQLELERSEFKADVDKKKIELDLEKARAKG
jgi:multidrug efflux pump subunit AcrA (membrane-fusion protein)